jgi:hypothetical protein
MCNLLAKVARGFLPKNTKYIKGPVSPEDYIPEVIW